jgi:hypothetical protein
MNDFEPTLRSVAKLLATVVTALGFLILYVSGGSPPVILVTMVLIIFVWIIAAALWS